MREFDSIKDMIYQELDGISRQGQLNKETVCVLGELVDILKDIGSVEMFEEGVQIEEDGYTFMGDFQRGKEGYSQGRMPIYYNGNSYRGGRGMNYSYGRGGSRGGGYSRDNGKEHMIEKLERLMNDVHDPEDRDAIQRLINQMEEK